MAISIQGGLYATCSYSTDRTTTPAQYQDTCANPNIATVPNGQFVNWNDFNLGQAITYLQAKSYALLGPTCFSGGSRRLQSTDAKTDEYNHHETHTYYPGVALVLSGPMYVSSCCDCVAVFAKR
jgi:hypothetical protein